MFDFKLITNQLFLEQQIFSSLIVYTYIHTELLELKLEERTLLLAYILLSYKICKIFKRIVLFSVAEKITF